MGMCNPLERSKFVRKCPHCNQLVMVSYAETRLTKPSADVEKEIQNRKTAIERMHNELVELGITLADVIEKEKGSNEQGA